MKVEVDGAMLTVELRCRTWGLAANVMLRNRSEPPSGYKLISGYVKNRSSSGARASLTLKFRHVDTDTKPFVDHAETCVFFEGDQQAANGD